MLKRNLYLIITLLLAACSATPNPSVSPQNNNPSSNLQGTAAVPTIDVKTIPTISPELHNSDPDLEKAITRPDELPDGITSSTAEELPAIFRLMPGADAVAYRALKRGALAAGDVAIFRYNSDQLATLAYKNLVSDFTGDIQDVKNLGDQAKAVPISRQLKNSKLEFVDIAFQRCTYVVHVRLAGSTDTEPAIQMAQKVDSRLKELACQK